MGIENKTTFIPSTGRRTVRLTHDLGQLDQRLVETGRAAGVDFGPVQETRRHTAKAMQPTPAALPTSA